MNPIEFKEGEFAQEIFTGEIVQIIKHGSWWTKLRNDDGRTFELNSCNIEIFCIFAKVLLEINKW